MRSFLRNKFLHVAVLLAGALVLLTQGTELRSKEAFHSEEELKGFRHLWRALPVGANTLFGGSGLCADCHAHDPTGFAYTDANGTDVNVTDDWRATMMANSARDPFWRAKVSHEILVNPAHANELQHTCTKCHAPIGHFNAVHNGATLYTIADMVSDSLALDGVNCSACHQLKDTALVSTFSGNLNYTKDRTVYGPYTNPFGGPMSGQVGFTPVYGAHMTDSKVCAGCHTLITETADLAGNPTGNSFFEQTTYHEWLNSIYSSNGQSCQQCHMPSINDPVVIAEGFPFLLGRSPFAKHHFAGANVFMLKLLKDNIQSLNLQATAAQFDSVILRTTRLLQDSALFLNLNQIARTPDTVFYSLELQNNSGHKFPSGYPARRAFVEFVVMDDQGDTLFSSGLHNSLGELPQQDPVLESHHGMINSSSQVQIYEMVLGDVNGDVTTVLERTAAPLKDNRIPPQGFVSSHFSYDTIQIVGNALNDADFNKNGALEGTGRDDLRFHVPLNGYTGDLNVTARVYYQSVPARWLIEMFSFNSVEIDLFRNLFDQADHAPVLVREIKQGDLFSRINPSTLKKIELYPNPAVNGQFTINLKGSGELKTIKVLDLQGKLQRTTLQKQAQKVQVQLHSAKGTYLVVVETSKGTFTERLVVLD